MKADERQYGRPGTERAWEKLDFRKHRQLYWTRLPAQPYVARQAI